MVVLFTACRVNDEDEGCRLARGVGGRILTSAPVSTKKRVPVVQSAK